MKRVHVWVSGRVQGVFFRQSARIEAGRLQVNGWVRNLPDGRVEAVAEGTTAAVDAWLTWCQKGPPGALVRQIDAQDETPEGLAEFQVLT